MATKSLGRKIRFGKRAKQNRPMPIWVVVKTKRKVVRNAKRYNWRHTALKR